MHQKIYSAVEDNPRSSVSESIRIAISNFEFINPNTDELSENTIKNTILVTSSIKGEGKTLVSFNGASALSMKNNKVILYIFREY